MSAAERMDIVNYLATHSKAGDLMEGMGLYPSLLGTQGIEVT
jgi:hypothetical protein